MSSIDFDLSDLEPSFEQIPYAEVLRRVESGTQSILEFSRIISAALENMQKNIAFSSNISRTHIYENEIPHSGCERSLGFFKNYHLFVAKGQVQYYKDLSEVIHKSIEEVKNNRINISNKHKNNVLNATKEVAIATESLDKAKKLYAKANLEMMGAKDKLQQLDVELERLQEEKRSNFMGRMLSAFESTPSQDRDKQQRRVHKRLNNVMLCYNEITAKKKILREKLYLRDYAISQATEAAQALEYERISCIKENIKKFCELEWEMINTRKHLLTSLQEVVESSNVKEDIQLFVKSEKKVELTHKYSKAIDLLDWDYSRRNKKMNNADIRYSDTMIDGGKEPLLSSVTVASIDDDDKTLPSASVIASHFVIPTENNDNGLASNSVGRKSIVSSVKKTLRLSKQKNKFKNESNDINQSSIELNSEIKVSKHDEVDDLENYVDEDTLNTSDIIPIDITFGTPNNVFLSVNAMNSSDDNIVGEVIDIPIEVPSDEPIIENTSNISSIVKDALNYIFDDKNNDTDSNNLYNIEDEWNNILESRECRDYFLQELDDKRGRYSQLSIRGYEAMKHAMKIALDFSSRLQDVKSALRIVNMANTFHCIVSKDQSYSEDDSKLYLLKEEAIRGHHIWHGKGFWEYSLIERLSTELQLNEPVVWDELNPDALREAVIGIHNIVFGQLGTIAFTMHELGLPFEEVQATVLEMSRGAQLVEEQEHDLLRSIRKTFNVSLENYNNNKVDSSNITMQMLDERQEMLGMPIIDDDLYRSLQPVKYESSDVGDNSSNNSSHDLSNTQAVATAYADSNNNSNNEQNLNTKGFSEEQVEDLTNNNNDSYSADNTTTNVNLFLDDNIMSIQKVESIDEIQL